MRPFVLIVFLVLAGSLVFASACQFYQPSIADIKVGNQIDDKTKEVVSPLVVFPAQTELIYASVYLKNALTDTKLRATWQWENHPLSEPTEIDAGGSRFVEFNIQRPRDGWKSGNYTVTIEIPDTDQSLSANFDIE